MDMQLFSNKEFSDIYHNGMIPSSPKVMNLIITYLEEKKGKPFDLAVDVGCGTGKYTRPLAAYFQKVIGIDICESQINVARRFASQENVFYQVSSADNMPLKDASVDLINAGLAAHWFNTDTFIPEAARVLKQGGCLALHAFVPRFELHYQDISGTLTNIIGEAFDILCKYDDTANEIMRSQYQKILESIPFTTKERLVEALGESSCQVKMELHVNFFCILACKS
ncbi:putative methyltransferase [Rhinophrynus dorsalis]